MTVPEFLRAVASGEQSLAGWWFVGLSGLLGGVIGSFLNVVVYRLPRGMSLAHPGSHCPHCGHAIRWHDNVPVLGWLLLGGRCRDCRAGISARYPLVEGFVALLFAGFAWLEVASGGINLPRRMPLAGEDPAALAWLRYAGHMLLICTLLAAALMERDGQPAPRRLWALALALGFAAAIWWPALRPMALPLAALPLAFGERLQAPWKIGLAEGVCGLAAGLVLGAAIFGKGAFGLSNGRQTTRQPPTTAPQNRSTCEPTTATYSSTAGLLAVVGVFLGLQAVCWVAAGSVAWRALGRTWARPIVAYGYGGPVAGLFVATLAYLLAWRWLAALESRPGVQWLWLALAIAALFGRMLFARHSRDTKTEQP